MKNLATIVARPLRPPLPPHATLGIVRGCDLNCIMCRMPERVGPVQFMPLELFSRVYGELNPWRLSLSNDGDPILHPDLISILRMARGSVVSMTTHFNRLPFGPEELVDSGLAVLKVSLDAATADTYWKVRGADLRQTVANIKAVLGTSRARGASELPLRLQFVIQRDNQHEIVDFIRLALELGIKNVLVMRAVVPGRPGIVDPGIRDDVNRQFVVESIRKAEELASSHGLTTNLRSMLSFYSKNAGTKPFRADGLVRRWRALPVSSARLRCVYPWVSTVVQPSGLVLPCCNVSEDNEPAAVLGDVSKTGFAEVWHGGAYRRLRKSLMSTVIPTSVPCAGCPAALDVPKLLEYAASLVPGWLS